MSWGGEGVPRAVGRALWAGKLVWGSTWARGDKQFTFISFGTKIPCPFPVSVHLEGPWSVSLPSLDVSAWADVLW